MPDTTTTSTTEHTPRAGPAGLPGRDPPGAVRARVHARSPRKGGDGTGGPPGTGRMRGGSQRRENNTRCAADSLDVALNQHDSANPPNATFTNTAIAHNSTKNGSRFIRTI